MADLEKIAEDLSSLTVLEAAELSNMLEEKWGVSAAAPVADPLNRASQETDAASRQPPIVTVVTGDQSQPAQPGGNRPTAVPTGISASDTGTETFSKAKTMLID